MERYDVAIVGAGPAGSTCAYELGKAGKKVALFDHSHPREKPCGGAIPTPILSEFSIPRNVVDFLGGHVILKSPSGETVKLYRKNVGATVMRKKFDDFLLKRASVVSDFFDKKVIDFEEKENGWIIKTNKKRVYANFLVGADGCPSLVRKKVLGPIDKQNLAHCVGYHLRHTRHHLSNKFSKISEIHFYNLPTSCGYIWVLPKLDWVNIGLGDRLGTKMLNTRLEEFISKDKRVAPIEKKIYSHLLPFIRNSNFFDLPTTGKNWALVGDAAGHVNPITGEGISFAMIDGRLAAQAIVEDDLKIYENGWRRINGSYLYLGVRYKPLLYNRHILDLLIKKANKSRELREFLIDFMGSVKPYDKLLGVKSFPRFLKIIKEVIFNNKDNH